MTAALLLLAAAVVVAPWRAPAARRLLDLGSSPAPGPPGPPAGRAPRSGPGLGPLIERATSRFGPPGRSRSGLPRLSSSVRRRDTGSLARMLDLLAVALLAGLPSHLALSAVADAVEPADPDLADPLRTASARVRLGATPAEAWDEVPGAHRLAAVVPVLARATDGGGPVRSALDHAAARMRSQADSEATARAERAAVLVAGPLGLCFLPAFICLGVLPVVVGLADGMLPGAMP